jgi:hypothetical protein
LLNIKGLFLVLIASGNKIILLGLGLAFFATVIITMAIATKIFKG